MKTIVVHIDGRKIKTLRENQELTQLYLATVVGVTTDTISRWENRRYPSIKRENGLKLAEALAVDLEDILEVQKNPDEPGEAESDVEGPVEIQQSPPKKLSLSKPIRLVITATVLLAALTLIVYFQQQDSKPNFQIRRILPAHTAPGVPFPVVITISGTSNSEVSIIVRDKLSCDCQTVDLSSASEKKKFGNRPRWIGRVNRKMMSFVYKVLPSKSLSLGDEIIFTGDLVTKQESASGEMIGGRNTISIAPFHWADSNQDYVINDEEMLMVYEDFSAAERGGFNFDLVEELWLAGRYSWNMKKLSFIPESR